MKVDKKILDAIINNLTDFEILILALLDSNNKEPIKDDVFYQKEIFVVLKFIKELLPKADFIPHTLGPYSAVAEKSLRNLTSYNLVEKKEYQYAISDLGSEIFKKVENKLSNDKLEAIKDFKVFLNDLTKDELLVYTYMSYPEFTIESSIRNQVYSKRRSVAVSLYKKNKVSLEKASFLAEMPLEDFINYLKGKS